MKGRHFHLLLAEFTAGRLAAGFAGEFAFLVSYWRGRAGRITLRS